VIVYVNVVFTSGGKSVSFVICFAVAVLRFKGSRRSIADARRTPAPRHESLDATPSGAGIVIVI